MNKENYFVHMFSKLENEIYDIATSKGWVHEDDEAKSVVLMHSELSEVIEWDRLGNPSSNHIAEFSGIEEEYADVIIRILDRAKFKKYNIAGAILAKIKFNKGRAYKHGGKKY